LSELALIRELEGVASRAWPARITKDLGGWLLRATGGITRRANSVLPLGKLNEANLEDAIEIVLKFYTEQNLPPRFQMTRASLPKELDNVLADHDFKVEMHVLVETAALDASDSIIIINQNSDLDVCIQSTPSNDWFEVYAMGTGYDEFSIETRKEIMARVPYQKAYAEVRINGEIVGLGFGVVEGEWLGLFSITTLSYYRRRGIASAISCKLAQWGKVNGATKAYLQVTEGNEPAIELYHRLGFREYYRYWYRLIE
jgi:ribosomal protein S18 acetylase RimI-like enzyme